ncbi:multifunctional protein ADE2 [Pangasianodon hypophthalmus]|uniref:multifunctional protein ADE2 n=1 Tax=Pangasianodon hypophthalmus TaxID=310915 RepID=UPI0023073A2A|nr:multifunctional protein ADE2 [Pangasianodon hypophthalmus]
MELSTEQKASREEQECQRGASGRWGGEEVRALLVVWREREAWDENETKAKYEAISSRLSELGVHRDWLSCQAQSRAMALPDWRPPAIRTAMDSTTVTQRSYEMDEEQTSPSNRRQVNASLSNFQEGSGDQHFVPLSGMEGGRHWSDKEIRALLNIWADREMQVRLQSTHRNKAIFQEMARRLELQHGVVRDWRQCRTKYKNLKYDYKVSKSQGRPMRFFAEVDAILQGKDIEDFLDEEEDSPRKGTEGDQTAARREPGEAHYIKIDDDESLADMQTIINTGSHHLITKDTGSSISPGARRPSDEENVITVHDSGRNWSEEEVAALLNIWSEEGIQQQLQGSTRNKDVFVQISRRLLQQGVERDWKQCRTKYKNLKYLYRSLQRGKADIGDTRRIMKFYEQLDSILSQPVRGLYRNSGMFSPPTLEEHSICEMPTHEDSDIIAVGYDQQTMDDAILRRSPGIATRAFQNEARTDAILRPEELTGVEYETEDQLNGMLVRSKDGVQTRYEERPLSSHSVTASTYGAGQEYKVNTGDTETVTEREPAGLRRGKKRKATDEDYSVFSKRFQECVDDGDSSTDWSEHVDYQCKEEQDQYIPIMEISSVRSMADTNDNLVSRESALSNTHPDFLKSCVKKCKFTFPSRLLGWPLARGNTAENPTFLSNTGFFKLHDQHYSKLPSQSTKNYKTSLPTLPDNLPVRPRAASCSRLCRKVPTTEMGGGSNRLEKSLLSAKSQTTLLHRAPRETFPRGEDGVTACFFIKCRNSVFLLALSSRAAPFRARAHCLQEQAQLQLLRTVVSVVDDNLLVFLQDNRFGTEMASTAELKLGKKLSEGKTKQIFELPDMPGQVLVQSKDQITAGNAVRKDQMEGKAAISNKTTSCVFKLLQEAGIKTAFVKQHSETAFIASHCEMIPIEWVCRRIATGSFLKRNPGVKEGYRFSPLKMEMFFKDDANNDPQWSEEQLLAAGFELAGVKIGRCEVDIMSKSTVAIFEVLEKAWATQNCTLVDMKIEFGVNVTTKEVVLADVIDNDSWRLWPAGDRSQQKDKQVYRDLKEVTPEAMQMVKRNFEWVAERVQLLLEPQVSGRVVVLMGSTSDMAHCERIRKACDSYGISCHLRVTSAHKGPDETLRIKSEYEGDGVPTIFVAVAGRSNGLGPVMSGNTVYPVINCPPVTSDWGAQDIWSSLRMPSGLGCSTVLSPDSAAQHAAQILGLTDHLVWAKLRASMLNTWISLKQADKKLQQCNI